MAANLSSAFTKSYNSFAGVDIRAVFGDKVIGTLQGISWSITREKAPIYTMGSEDPRAFARGKRGIAGSMVFITFDRAAITGEFFNALFWADKDSLKPEGFELSSVAGPRSTESTVFEQENSFGNITDPRDDQQVVTPWYPDQIPPFDITLSAANEYGAAMQMRIYGVEFLNVGSGSSIDDLVLEEQCTYIARSIQPWTSKGFSDPRNARPASVATANSGT